MAEEHLDKPKRSFRIRRGGIEEVRKITDPKEFAVAAANYLGIAPITLPAGYIPTPDLLCGMNREAWERVKAIPLMRIRGRLTVAFADPFDLPAQEEISRWGRGKIWSVVAPANELTDIFAKMKQAEDSANPALAMENIMKGDEGEIEMTSGDSPEESALDATIDAAGDAPVIRMVNTIMVEALKTKASDIHFEALEKTSRLRYRIDGELVERPAPPRALHNAVCSRIRILSNLDIAERRRPQDGRFKVRAMKKEVDVRVSILPTVHGEKVVMRILDKA
ncbi:MAG: Flp pilus assembly complex ATPase component TadA, partial [Kiritimatiellae bacterium]|nr:Flp pilus assembly complex ATPase component TadA [Kiritimatiellia bacterium]